jgi:hypothetical protein
MLRASCRFSPTKIGEKVVSNRYFRLFLQFFGASRQSLSMRGRSFNSESIAAFISGSRLCSARVSR